MTQKSLTWRWWAAAGWALLMGAVLGHTAWLLLGGLTTETDLLALLPPSEALQRAAPLAEAAASKSQREVIILVTADSRELAEQAAGQAEQALPLEWQRPAVDTERLTRALAPHRAGLLDEEQIQSLNTSPDMLSARAWASLTQPLGIRMGAIADDPLGLFSESLSRHATQSRVAPDRARWTLPLAARPTVVLRGRLNGNPFSLTGAQPLGSSLTTLRQSLPVGVELHAAGVPLFAEVAAAQAASEVSTVGLGSLLGIIVLMWLAFRSPRPLLWVVASVGLGVAAGLSATALVFGKVHLLTLVFGASLVGVAEDYGIHWFVSRQQSPNESPTSLLRRLGPGLALATGTSIAGYVVLAAAPFPSLRQVAFFSSVGLATAFLTVAIWFPMVAGQPVAQTAFATRWATARPWWPNLSPQALALGSCVLALLTAGAISQLQIRDDVRALQSAPTSWLAEQTYVADALALPGPAQLFVVEGSTEAETLEREETLRQQLEALQSRGVLTSHIAVSQWVPSPNRQRRSINAFVNARDMALSAIRDELTDPTPSPLPAQPLKVNDLHDTPLWEALGPLWSATSSLVLLSGVTPQSLLELEAIQLPGVTFVDRTAEISQRLGRWRELMTRLLGPALLVIALALAWRFGRRFWRALLPVLLAGMVAIATVSMLRESYTLFHVLALYVLLGVGVDYGIFLLEHPAGGEAWLAVGLGAVSTLLSFGLLAVSRTQAVHAFGLTLGVGVAFVWFTAPLFAPVE